MDDYKKYKLKKNRKKIILLIIAFLLFLIGGIFFYHKYTNKDIDMSKFTDSNTVVKNIINAENNGNISLIKIKDNKKIDELKLDEGTYIYSKSNNLDYLVAYNKDKFAFYFINESNDKLKEKKVFDFKADDEISEIKCDGDFIYVMYKENNKISVINLKNKNISKIFLKDMAVNWAVKDSNIIFTNAKKIYRLDTKTNTTTNIDVGDISKDICNVNNKILVLNDFGKGLNTSVTFEIEPSNLKIDNLIKYESSNQIMLNSDGDGTDLITLNCNGKAQTINIYDLKKNNKLVSSKLSNCKITNDINAVGSRGYIYYKNDNDNFISVVNAKTGVCEYKINIENINFYMPLIK